VYSYTIVLLVFSSKYWWRPKQENKMTNYFLHIVNFLYSQILVVDLRTKW